MKHLFSPRHGLALALSGAVLPLAIVGCGGSNGILPPKVQPTTGPTTLPTTTPTTSPTTTPTTSPTTTPTTNPTTQPTTQPTVAPTSPACTNEPANFNFAEFSGSYNGSRANTTCGTGFAANIFGQPNTISATISLFEGLDTNVKQRGLTVFIDSPTTITAGTQYNLTANSSVDVTYSEFRGSSNTALVWKSASGTVTVQSISSTSITLVLSGVTMNSNSGGAAGSFRLGGTYTVPRPTSG